MKAHTRAAAAAVFAGLVLCCLVFTAAYYLYIRIFVPQWFIYQSLPLVVCGGVAAGFCVFVLLCCAKGWKNWAGFAQELENHFRQVIWDQKNLSRRLHRNFGKEPGRLAQQYNSMLAALDASVRDSEKKLQRVKSQRDRLKNLAFLFRKHLPDEILSRLGEHNIEEVVKKRTGVCSLSIELVNFLEPVEKVYPEIIIEELAGFNSFIKRYSISRGGFINYSTGYFINVVFGINTPQERSFAHAVELCRAVYTWVQKRNSSAENKSGIKWKLKAGISCGSGMAGSIGSRFMVVGKVLEQSRLMLDRARYFDVFLVSDAGSEIKQLGEARYRRLDLKNHKQDVRNTLTRPQYIYEIFIADHPGLNNALTLYHHGLDMFYEGKYDIAVYDFKKVDRIFQEIRAEETPGDPPSRVFLNKCEKMIG
ncbi:MAG: hypothetical protein ACOC7U_06540 [Spirochaetota bacterium]